MYILVRYTLHIVVGSPLYDLQLTKLKKKNKIQVVENWLPILK